MNTSVRIFTLIAIIFLFSACSDQSTITPAPTTDIQVSQNNETAVKKEGDEPPIEPTSTAKSDIAKSAEQRLDPTDLVYLGAFAFPEGDEWAYSGHALAFYPNGDPAGANDGFAGSLYTAAHIHNNLVGEISIPEPSQSKNFESLPKAEIRQERSDITEGWINNCTFDAECEYREVAGLAYLPNVDKIAWNLRDWYNVDGDDQDSLGLSDIDMQNAQGVWHIGSRQDPAFHNAKSSNYLFNAPVDFANTYFSGKWLIAGNHRQAGAFGGSQGPALIASAPLEDGFPPDPGQDLAALALLYYPENIPCTENDFEQCAYPGYRVADDWGGGAWVEADGKTAVLIFGLKGLGDNCYGIPGEDCPVSLCDDSKGWHSSPYEPQILFYDPQDLAAVVADQMQPWDVLPYAIAIPTENMFNPDCARLNAVAYDAENQIIYVTESVAGPWGETAVHVWQILTNKRTDP